MKEIILKHGQRVLVDDEDYEWLNKMTWHGGKYISSVYKIGPFVIKKWLMHRLIMCCDDPNLEVDHKNHNRWDNRKSNLRICTSGQNTSNRSVSKSKKTSKYLGVCYTNSTWRASAKSKDKRLCSTFPSEHEAALGYNKMAMELHGDFANLNNVYIP